MYIYVDIYTYLGIIGKTQGAKLTHLFSSWPNRAKIFFEFRLHFFLYFLKLDVFGRK